MVYNKKTRTKERSAEFEVSVVVNTVLFEMIVGVLTTCHTPHSPDATPCDLFL